MDELTPLTHKKRIRYKIPTYKKSDKIIKNILKYEGNQKHIFRLKTLHDIYQEIAFELFHHQMTIPLLLEDYKLTRGGLSISFEKEKNKVTKRWENYITAEVIGTENLPIKDRLKIHIEALRDLRAGRKVKKYKPKKKKVKEVA